MHFLKYVTLAFAATAIAAPATSSPKVTAEKVKADLGVIRQTNLALSKSVSNFQGGLLGLTALLDLNSRSDNVANAIKQTTTDANAATPFTVQQSVDIATIVNQMSPEIIKTLDIFKGKRGAFDNPAPLSIVIKNKLGQQKRLTVDLVAAITAKVPQQLKAASSNIAKPLLAKFDEVIKVYS